MKLQTPEPEQDAGSALSNTQSETEPSHISMTTWWASAKGGGHRRMDARYADGQTLITIRGVREHRGTTRQSTNTRYKAANNENEYSGAELAV